MKCLNQKQNQTDEIYFLEKARNKGFKFYCFTKVKCEHLVFQKYEKDLNGNLKHPLFT